MLERGQGVFYVLATGLIAAVLITLRRLPPVVASHFDAAGMPNGWSSRPVYALLLVAIGVLLPLGITVLIRGLTRHGPGRLTFPRETTGLARSIARKRCAVCARTCGGWGVSWRERRS